MPTFKKPKGNQSALVTGLADVDRRLKGLANAAKRKVVRASTGAGMTAYARVVRQAIDSEPISPELKRALKFSVGKRFRRLRNQDAMAAKVGLGVGKQRPGRRSGKNTGGVGIGGANAHWFLLGTRKRRVKTTGQNTGRIQKLRIMQKANGPGSAAAFAAMRTKADEVLKQEVERLRRT